MGCSSALSAALPCVGGTFCRQPLFDEIGNPWRGGVITRARHLHRSDPVFLAGVFYRGILFAIRRASDFAMATHKPCLPRLGTPSLTVAAPKRSASISMRVLTLREGCWPGGLTTKMPAAGIG